MTKKFLSLALALILCLGLAVPVLAESYTQTFDNTTVSVSSSGGKLDVSFSGTGKVNQEALDYANELSFNEILGSGSINAVSITFGEGITALDSADGGRAAGFMSEVCTAIFGAGNISCSVTFPSSLTGPVGSEVYCYIADMCSSDNGTLNINYNGTRDQLDKIFDGYLYTLEEFDSVRFNYSGSGTPAPKVQLSSQAVTVNGKAVETEVYNIDGSNYFKLRDVAMMLGGTAAQFSVDYDAAARAITAKSGEAYEPVGGELQTGEDKSASCVVSDQPIAVNGETLSVTVYNIGGNNFFMLRDLGSALGFGVDYDAAARTVLITTE